MTAPAQFSFLDHAKKQRDYATEIILHGQKVIPSDTFDIDGNEFVILDIVPSETATTIKLLGIRGSVLGNMYLLPQEAFDDISINHINSYQIH